MSKSKPPQPPKKKATPKPQPDTLRIVESKVAEQAGDIMVGLSEGPAKPSGEAAEVRSVIEQTIQRFGYVSEVGQLGVIDAIVTDLVRRFPGLTRKPGEQVHERTRLPHGSEYTIRYDAADLTWWGKLSVPEMDELRAVHPGAFGLLRKLDTIYRKSTRKTP